MHYSELDLLPTIPNITIKQYGRGCFIYADPTEDDVNAARAGLDEMGRILQSGEYDLVVLDEVNIALYFKLFSVENLIRVLENRSPEVEVVLTGRYAPQEIVDMADLVTEMREIKHYYSQGVEARTGIEK